MQIFVYFQIIFMNSTAAVLIGGISGMSICIWFDDPHIGKYSESTAAVFLLAEAIGSLFTAIVYLIDIGNNVNTLKSLSF